jgi:protoheme IX farnesyltransferase
MEFLKKYSIIFYELTKFRITIFVAISATAGYILSFGKLDWGMILPVLGVFILSCGASALNQWQENIPDSKMNRTKYRPIPIGALSKKEAFYISTGLSISGLFLIYVSSGLTALILGLGALIWYNIIYTPLKKITALAVVPGALVGTFAPTIGWVGGGGELLNIQIWIFNLFIFIWQVPHFWLLLLIYDDDYRRADFPTLTDIFTPAQLSKVTFMWIAALAVSCMLIPLFGLLNNPLTAMFLFLAGLWLLWRTKNLAKQYSQINTVWVAFREVNVYVLIVVVLLSIDKLIVL